MRLHFFDTSALVKRYHPEIGSDAVDALFADPLNIPIISKLGCIETSSAFAKQVRNEFIGEATFRNYCTRLDADCHTLRIRVLRVTVPHFNIADQLIRRISPLRNLRSLDAIQLAVALDLNADSPIAFVTADSILGEIARDEGLIVINPEVEESKS